MANLIFHQCTLNDWQTLRDISIETFTNTYQNKNKPEDFQQHIYNAFNENQLQKELANPNCDFYFLKKKENILVGYLKLNILNAQTEPMNDEYLEVERIYVLKKFQGKGFGKKMLEFSKEKAIEKQKKKIWLGVWEKNPKAIAFYKKMGFEKTGTHTFKVGEDEQLDFVMETKTG